MSVSAKQRAKQYASDWTDHMFGDQQMAIWLFIIVLTFAQLAIFAVLADEGMISNIDGLAKAYEIMAYVLLFQVVGGIYILTGVIKEIGYQVGYFDAEDLGVEPA